MKVSFIIPLYNCLPLTQAMLASLQATLPSGLTHEIIFVDDGSTDGTRAWLATLPPPCRSLLNEQNLGFADACNQGAAAAKGDTLFFLNNDLVLLPGWFEPILDGFARLPQAGIIGNIQLRHSDRSLDHAGIVIGADGKPAHIKTMPASSSAAPGYAAVPAITGACLAVPRELFARLGAYDVNYKNSGEDIDLCFRAHGGGCTIWVALKSVVLHHISASPGRNNHNEANSYRLSRQWHGRLEREAWLTWCLAFLADTQAGILPRHPLAEKAARNFLQGRQTRPGQWAESNVRQNMLAEQARWEQMFPDIPNALATPAGSPLS